MPINPITLDKKEPIIIRQIEHRVIDRVVHETRGAEIGKEGDKGSNGFNHQQQAREAQRLGKYLEGYKLKLDYKLKKNKISIKISDSKGNLLIEADIEDIIKLHSAIKRETGAIIDMKG